MFSLKPTQTHIIISKQEEEFDLLVSSDKWMNLHIFHIIAVGSDNLCLKHFRGGIPADCDSAILFVWEVTVMLPQSC